jgi:hypothetical protein
MIVVGGLVGTEGGAKGSLVSSVGKGRNGSKSHR